MPFEPANFKEDFGKAMEQYQQGMSSGKPAGHLELNFYSALTRSGYGHEGSAFSTIPSILPQLEKERGAPFEHLPKELPSAMKNFAGESSPEYAALMNIYQDRKSGQSLGNASTTELSAAAAAPSASAGKPSDTAIHAQLSSNNAKFDMFTARMDAFNNHPDIREAHDRAQKYGIEPNKTIHEALDKNPALKESFLKVHKMFHEHIQPLMEDHMKQSNALQDPEMRKQAQEGLQARMENMDKAQKSWPDRHDITGEKPDNAAHGAPSLGAVIAHLLHKLKEMIMGRSPEHPQAGPAAESTAKNTQTMTIQTAEVSNNQRPSMRRKP
jgi:hypothetical protein